jgi:hypothetical protein
MTCGFCNGVRKMFGLAPAIPKAPKALDPSIWYANKYTSGRLFDPGAQRAALHWNTSLPAYSVLGPGNNVQRQLGVSQPGAFLPEKALVIQGAAGFGTPADFQVQQGLLNPNQNVGSTGSSKAGSI